MRDRLVGEEIATTSAGRAEVRQKVLDSPVMKMFRQSLFARVVPNIKKLGLLTPARAQGLRAARDHPVRELRRRGGGPRNRPRVTAAIRRTERRRSFFASLFFV
jgi:hypothetical protein